MSLFCFLLSVSYFLYWELIYSHTTDLYNYHEISYQSQFK